MTLEDEGTRRTRQLVVGVVFLFLVLFGWPSFHLSTRIHRAELPVEEVALRQLLFAEDVRIRIPVRVSGPKEELQAAVDARLALECDDAAAWGVHLTDEGYPVEFHSGETQSVPGSQRILIQRGNGSEAEALAEGLAQVFGLERQIVGDILGHALTKEVAFPYSLAYHVVFNLLVEGGQQVEWEAEEAVAALQPVFDSLAHFARFKVSTQVQYYAPLHHEPGFDADRRVRYIRSEDLSTFVNFNDWNLITHDTTPAINMLLYFGSGNFEGIPLEVEGGATSFLVPQWGGVCLYNLEMPLLGKTVLRKEHLAPYFQLFAAQLYELVGVPRRPESKHLRMDSWHRTTLLRNLQKTLENLASLVALSHSLGEIAIPDSARTHALEALEHYDSALRQDDIRAAVHCSSRSVESSDRAFFEKEMVQQAYFPSEHKLAVYLPLLGPLSFIVMLGLLAVMKQLKEEKETKKRELNEKKTV